MQAEILRSVSILHNLDDQELEHFARLLTPHEIPQGERILHEGKPVTAFYIVCDGVVHVRRMAQKREMLLGRLSVGGFFGEINLFDPGVATASIYAMSPVKLGVVDYDTLREFMLHNPRSGYKIVSAMMTEMAKRLRQTSSRLVNSVYWANQPAAAAPRLRKADSANADAAAL